MNNRIKALQQAIDQLVTVDALVTAVTSIVGEMLDAKWERTEKVGASYTVGDVLNVKGFYVVPWIVEDMISALCGRIMRLAALQFGVDVRDPKVIEILLSTQKVESQARPKVIELCRKKYGEPVAVDLAAAEALRQRHNAFLSQMFPDEKK